MMSGTDPRLRPYLSDEEVAEICFPLTQSAAQLRFLRKVVGLEAKKKPNGRPLVGRADFERAMMSRAQQAANEVMHDIQPDAAALAAFLDRRGRRGTQTQGR